MVEGLTDRIEAVKRHALEHYDDEGSRWDIIYETYEDGELAELLNTLGVDGANVPLEEVFKKVGAFTLDLYHAGGGGSEEW